MGQRRVTFLLTSICSAGAAGIAPIQSQSTGAESRPRCFRCRRNDPGSRTVMLFQARTPGSLVPGEIDDVNLAARVVFQAIASMPPVLHRQHSRALS